MEFRPILFSTPMVQAILNGTKFQTRRVIKGIDQLEGAYFQTLVQHATGRITFSSLNVDYAIEVKCPYGQVGDVIWVREKHRALVNCQDNSFASWSYYSDMPKEFHEQFPKKWTPSIHMPKTACRLFLKIKEIRVERLQDLSRGDAMGEGCPFPNMADGQNPKDWFAQLWQSINGEQSWNENPWVWVIEFEKIEKPENFC